MGMNPDSVHLVDSRKLRVDSSALAIMQTVTRN